MSEIIKLISGQDLQSNQYNEEGNGILYITGASCIENEKLKKIDGQNILKAYQ